MPIVSKGIKGGYAIARLTSTTTLWTNHANTQLGANNSPDETVDSMTIAQAKWAGTWVVSRAGNTILDLTGAGNFDFQEDGVTIETSAEASGNLVATLTGSGTLVLKLHKQSTYDPEYPTGN